MLARTHTLAGAQDNDVLEYADVMTMPPRTYEVCDMVRTLDHGINVTDLPAPHRLAERGW